MGPKKKATRTPTSSSASAEPKSTAQLISTTAAIPTLYYNKLKGSGNFSVWREKFGIYVGSKYGRCQDLILTGKKYVPPEIPVPPDELLSRENDPHGIHLKCYQKAETSRLEQILKMEEEYPRIYNDLLATFSRESEEMVKQHSNFAAADRAKCPGLLMAIVAITHQQPQSGAKEVDADTALARYFELKQGNKSLAQHKKDFDDAVDMLVASGEQRPADDKLAIRFIASLDPNRYAQWKVDLENDVKAGLDVMPKTLSAAYSRAFNLKKVGHSTQQIADASVFVTASERDNRKSKSKGKGKGEREKHTTNGSDDRKPAANCNKGKGGSSAACHLCKQTGHYVSNCPLIKDDEVTKFIRERLVAQGATQGGVDAVHLGAQDRGTSSNSASNSNYGTAGYVVLPTIGSCEDQRTHQTAQGSYRASSAENFKNVAAGSNVGTDHDGDEPPPLVHESDVYDSDEDDIVDEVAIAVPAAQERRLGEYILLLDNQASMSVVWNAELLTDIRPADHPVRIDGIGGHLVINEVGNLEDFGTVYYHPDALANVLCFADVEDLGSIVYSQEKSSFDVVIANNHYHFRRVQSGNARKLYACDLRRHMRERIGTVNVTTVSGNEAMFTRREVGDARRARDLSRKLGYPSLNHLVKMVKHMENSPVRVADVYRAAKIWGPEIAYLKGTTRNKKTEHIPVEELPRPIGREVQTLHVDLVYVEGEGFLYSKTAPLGLRMANHLGHGKGARTTSNIQPHLERQLSHYSAAGFSIGTLLTDNEGGVAGCVSAIQAKGIKVNPSSAGKHVPVIENDIKTLKSRVRTHIHALPFNLCSLLLVWLVLYCVSTLNMEPSSTNLDDFSPREVFLHRGVNYKRDIRVGFGDYVQVQVPLDDHEKNKMIARTEGAIALWPTGNLQGSVKFLLLGSMRVVTRDQWVPLPMPPPVIELLNKLAEKQPVSRDPKFSVGGQEIGEPEAEPDEHPAEAIRDGPVRYIPEQESLANPISDPTLEVTSGTTVLLNRSLLTN